MAGFEYLAVLVPRRYIEPFALLVAQLAYEGKGSSLLAYRFQPFRKRA